MASRKEEKERLRQQRLEAERQAAAAGRRRVILGYVGAGILAAVIIVGLVIALAGGGDEDGGGTTEASGENVSTEFGGRVPAGVQVDDRVGTEPPPVEIGDLTAAAEAAGCELRLDLEDEGSTHLDPQSDDLPDYGTNPPTSGDHYPVPLADGAFLDKPSPGSYVHSLEHGRIIIQYSPDLPEEDQLALKGVFDADRPGVDLFPDPDMPYAVATTAWTQLMTCKTFEGPATLDAIRAFRDAYRGRGPEAIPF
ncbi:MAG TPA: DUF3105 domain-containing protein [Solirubrobacterales bacterium]|nr:DUF3105 domain-containing protein [Solirubrobacterales bacterium]